MYNVYSLWPAAPDPRVQGANEVKQGATGETCTPPTHQGVPTGVQGRQGTNYYFVFHTDTVSPAVRWCQSTHCWNSSVSCKDQCAVHQIQSRVA